MSESGGDHGVLVVDDEQAVADMAAAMLQGEYAVRTAYGGTEALEELDPSIDVMLLDRRMPDLSGDEVLTRIRERDDDYRVVILSAVSPDYDVLEMPFDDYLCKPLAGEPVKTAVAQQIRTLGDATAREYLGLVATRDLLEDAKPSYELERHEGYQRLLERIDDVRGRLEEGTDPERLADVKRV